MTKTDDNLKAAFMGESAARNKYTFFAEIARNEGYHYLAKIFEEIAENEKFHALEEYRLLHGNADTASSLKAAIEGEKYESEKMYPEYAEIAEIEGNHRAEILFNQIAKIEKRHRERFEKLLEMVESGTVFYRDSPIRWKCSVCGYTYEGHEPPNRCPFCKKSKAYYEPANLDV